MSCRRPPSTPSTLTERMRCGHSVSDHPGRNVVRDGHRFLGRSRHASTPSRSSGRIARPRLPKHFRRVFLGRRARSQIRRTSSVLPAVLSDRRIFKQRLVVLNFADFRHEP